MQHHSKGHHTDLRVNPREFPLLQEVSLLSPPFYRQLKSLFFTPPNPTTSFLTATTLIYAIGAGITAAAGTRLALQLVLVKFFTLYSFQLLGSIESSIVIYCHYLSALEVDNLRACCLPWMWWPFLRPPLRNRTLILRYSWRPW